MCGRWQSDATEFTVGVNYVEGRGYQSTIPKPVADLLGLEGSITFKVSGRNVMVVSGRVPAAAGRGPPPGRPDRAGPAAGPRESTPSALAGASPPPARRLRRLRGSAPMRDLLRETRLSPQDMVSPLFVQEGLSARAEVDSMPGVYRVPVSEAAAEAGDALAAGVPAVMVFGIPSSKDDEGSQAYDDGGVAQSAISAIRAAHGDRIAIMSDVCLCQYTSTGHCGVVRGGAVDNDASVELLARTAVSQARAGADVVSPSAMMDGQVAAIRAALDREGLGGVAIMSHSAKHRSSMYAPFRDAADCAPRFGDRRTYQVPYSNAREAMAEVAADVAEGVDIVMIKPALAYLDLVAESRRRFGVPVAAYSVSGEYSLVSAAARLGWVDGERVMLEMLTSMRRAGADIIVTYFAKAAARALAARGGGAGAGAGDAP